jgi:hypothetical protein
MSINQHTRWAVLHNGTPVYPSGGKLLGSVTEASLFARAVSTDLQEQPVVVVGSADNTIDGWRDGDVLARYRGGQRLPHDAMA